jgi:hypothetical protein
MGETHVAELFSAARKKPLKTERYYFRQLGKNAKNRTILFLAVFNFLRPPQKNRQKLWAITAESCPNFLWPN